MRNANKSLLKLVDYKNDNLESVIFLEQLWKNAIEINVLFEKIVETEDSQEAQPYLRKICAVLEDEIINGYQNSKDEINKIILN